MSGNVQIKTLSRKYLTNLSVAGILEILLLLGFGILAIVLRARLKTPINIPGHHGIEFMAIILASRLCSKIKWASSISAIGIGIILLFPVLGFNGPLMGFSYILPCFFIDFAYNFIKNNKYRNLLISIAAGLAYSLIPISRLITTLLTGIPFSSFVKHGFIAPIITFFIFGLLGGILSTGIFFLSKKIFK